MLGWEYPPVKSGGLGTACYGLTKELAALGQDIIFVSPFGIVSEKSKHLSLVSLRNYKIRGDVRSLKERILSKLNLTEDMKKHITYEFISSLLTPYLNEESYKKMHSKKLMEIRKLLTEKDLQLINRENEQYLVEYEANDDNSGEVYGPNLFQEVHDYSIKAEYVASQYDFDLIVAHDWMTFEAAVRIKKKTGKPLCVHIHATEIDRTGANVNQLIYDLERLGLHEADVVIANSRLTKQNCVMHFGVDPQRIIPIHLAIDNDEVNHDHLDGLMEKKPGEKFVLFLGRITMQKGPEYFLRAAAKALKVFPNIKFIMAGSGEKLDAMKMLVQQLKIEDNVLFPGFLQGDEIRQLLKVSDLFVLSSVSEPFGLVVLEAIKAGLPCIISKTTGVSEILDHVLKVDFWDTREMANKIVACLKYETLATVLRDYATKEADKYNWNWTAKRTLAVYEALLVKHGGALAHA
jgi:glycosyltransferase involved in cell wall biosynthesis